MQVERNLSTPTGAGWPLMSEYGLEHVLDWGKGSGKAIVMSIVFGVALALLANRRGDTATPVSRRRSTRHPAALVAGLQLIAGLAILAAVALGYTSRFRPDRVAVVSVVFALAAAVALAANAFARSLVFEMVAYSARSSYAHPTAQSPGGVLRVLTSPVFYLCTGTAYWAIAMTEYRGMRVVSGGLIGSALLTISLIAEWYGSRSAAGTAGTPGPVAAAAGSTSDHFTEGSGAVGTFGIGSIWVSLRSNTSSYKVDRQDSAQEGEQ